ncbi:hypothetical protein Mapa_009496 [Marchantia paleacea]|nr:hypothetical protein Mapa_009496 [Marchantia paleacea]
MTSPPNHILTRQESEVASELKLALEEACLEAGVTLSSSFASPKVTSFWFWEDHDAVPAGKLAGWLAAARKRSFWPIRHPKKKHSRLSDSANMSGSISSSDDSTRSSLELTASDQPDLNEISLKERLKKATELDIEPDKISWKTLSTVCRTEHMQEVADDDNAGAIEVNVNSGGVVYFALFQAEGADSGEAAACIKFAPSRLATQSELLGLELARHLGILTPQARVVHSGSNEWTAIIFAVEKAKEKAKVEENEVGENTCGELLEALNLSRSLLLMGYVDGGSLLSTPQAFTEQQTCERTAATLGRVMVLDLVLRNEDRLVCKQLGWLGNSGNLLATEKLPLGKLPGKERELSSIIPRSRGRGDKRTNNWNFRKQLKNQFESITSGRGPSSCLEKDASSRSPEGSSSSRLRTESSGELDGSSQSSDAEKSMTRSLHVVAIDSGVPRRPPSMKAEKDKADYPKFVELLLNDETIAAEILREISGNNLGYLHSEIEDEQTDRNVGNLDHRRIVKAFQEGFRAGAYDMQDLRMFLLRLFRRLNQLLREFVSYMASVEEKEEEESITSSPSSHAPSHQSSSNSGRRSTNNLSPLANELRSKLEKLNVDSGNEDSAPEENGSKRSSPMQKTRCPMLRRTKSPDNNSDTSPSGRSSSKSSPRMAKESWHGKLAQAPANPSQLGMRLTLKLKDVNKSAKVDGQLSKQLDYWDDRLRTECRKICKEQRFTTGFLDNSNNHSLIDSYELKVRLDHLLERMALIVQGVQTERPSCVLKHLYIGGVLSARSFFTLQRVGITHVLCLCPNEFSIEAEYSELYEFKSFQIRDVEDENISCYFEDACTFIDSVEEAEGVILVHCFEGKSRSAAVILAYLMIRKGQTLLQAWALLKAVHPRAQPNDGFMKILVRLDKELHGKVSMDWHQKKPQVRMCPICGKSAGISNVSLRHHIRKSHPDVTHVPLTTVRSPEAEKIETATCPLENVLSVVGL